MRIDAYKGCGRIASGVVMVGIFALALSTIGVGSAHADEMVMLWRPCRLMDTRVTGSRTVANSEIDFKVRGNSNSSAQGGEVNCDIPSYATGVVVSLVAVNPAASGYARIYQWNTPPPLAVTLLITGGQTTNVVSATTALSDFSFPLDIALYSTVASDFVVDLYGYTTDCPQLPTYLAALVTCSSGCSDMFTLASDVVGDTTLNATRCYKRASDHQLAHACAPHSLCTP